MPRNFIPTMSSTEFQTELATSECQQLATHLLHDVDLLQQTLFLRCGDCVIRLQSNSSTLLTLLRSYFHPFLCEAEHAVITVIAIQAPEPDLSYSFRDWRREPGKSGQKDAYYDFAGGRLIRKVRTGMLFLQSTVHRVAAGPCLDHPNQVVNFINAQYMNWLQQRQWKICHAAAVTLSENAYAIAGFSGGGKSTLMLQLLENPAVHFLTNDRLFIHRQSQIVDAIGIAKLPRINPGTIVNNPRLHELIPLPQRRQLLEMPIQKLWDLEEKYDVDIDRFYGVGHIAGQSLLKAFIVLNWRHESDSPTIIKPIDLRTRPDLLAAIIKSPGPFYQDSEGKFISDAEESNPQDYLTSLSRVAIYEVCGKVDFTAMTKIFFEQIVQESDQ